MNADQRLMAREMSQPKVLGEVLDEVIGVPASDVEVTQEAWDIINEYGEGLVLGFQWKTARLQRPPAVEGDTCLS